MTTQLELLPEVEPEPGGPPDIGIHHSIDFADYASWPFINSGAIKWGMVSMKHMRAALAGELEDTDSTARKFGRAVHLRLLEPDRYASEMKVATPCAMLLKSGDRKGQPCGKSGKFEVDGVWFCGTHAMKEAVEPADYVSVEEASSIERMAASLHDHPAMRMFKRSGWSEASLVFDLFGERCKGRIDRWAQPLILDVKKCQVGEADRESCERSILTYGWYRQAALYREGAKALTGEEHHFAWVFIEDGPPYDVQVIPADENTLAIGRYEVREVLRKWKMANESNEWSGYVQNPRNIPTGGLPDFYRRRYEQFDLES